jgi:hypothetical protein
MNWVGPPCILPKITLQNAREARNWPAAEIVLGLSLVYFGIVSGGYGLTYWLPQIVKGVAADIGLDQLTGIPINALTGYLVAVPFAFAAAAMILWTRHSDNTRERVWHVAGPASVGGLSLIAAAYLGSPALSAYFYQTPEKVVVIAQNGPEVRHIYLNVTHSTDVKPSWYGESVGHYENGDTLVIDTTGISANSFVDNYRTPHTDQLHVVERWKLAADGKTVDVSIFVEDPGAFTTP